MDYIKDLIQDAYDIEERSDWPYRYMTMDYEAAAEEAKQDYSVIEVVVDGVVYTYYGR